MYWLYLGFAKKIDEMEKPLQPPVVVASQCTRICCESGYLLSANWDDYRSAAL